MTKTCAESYKGEVQGRARLGLRTEEGPCETRLTVGFPHALAHGSHLI